jgi:hypothetical protein
MVMVSTFGLTAANIKDNGKTTLFLAKDSIIGLMEDSMTENGLIIICMAREFTHGWMGVVTRVNITSIRSKALVTINGSMGESIFQLKT